MLEFPFSGLPSRRLHPTNLLPTGVIITSSQTFKRANVQTFQRSSPKSFVCHTSEETLAKSNACHTSENSLPQVLCLPHLQDPRGVWSTFCSAPFLFPFRHSQLVFSAIPFFSNSSALFCTRAKPNSFVFKQFRTICEKHPGWGVAVPRISLRPYPITCLPPPMGNSVGSAGGVSAICSSCGKCCRSGSGTFTFLPLRMLMSCSAFTTALP